MEDKNHNIEELFRNSFSDYEENVRPELWNKISNQLDSSAVSGPDSAASGSAGSGTTSLVTGAIKWVAITAFVAATGVGAYYLVSEKNPDKSTSEPSQSVGTIITESGPSSTVNSQSQTSDDSKVSISHETEKNQSVIQNTATDQEQDHPLSSVSAHSDNQTVQNSGSSLNSTNRSGQTRSESTGIENNVAGQNQNQSSANESVVSQKNVFKLQADKLSGHAPLTVRFQASGTASQIEWDFGDGTNERNSSALSHTFSSPGEYVVSAKVIDGTTLKSEKITIFVTENIDIQDIPNIFTPNGDGINDFFRFDSFKFTEIEVFVYDQNGNQVFRFTDPSQGWDGSLKTGAEAKEGTYLYTIFATSQTGLKHQQKGWVKLIRNK